LEDGWADYWVISLSTGSGLRIGLWLARRWNLHFSNGDLPIARKRWIDKAIDTSHYSFVR
jgi:hypothetical protein